MTWIDLEGAVNVRDLGGLPTMDGGSTVPGRLLRSENLQELSPADIARLVKEIGVTTVVDLRTTGELEVEGPAPLDAVPAVRHVHRPVLKELGNASEAAAEALLITKLERDRARYPDDITTGHYLGYQEERPDQVTGALRDIATADGAWGAGETARHAGNADCADLTARSTSAALETGAWRYTSPVLGSITSE